MRKMPAPAFVQIGEIWRWHGLQIEPLSVIEHFDAQGLVIDGKTDPHGLLRVGGRTILDCVGHGFRQRQIKMIGERVAVPIGRVQLLRDLLGDIADQA